METPTKLKQLYQHWRLHTNPIITERHTTSLDSNRLKGVEKFAEERMRIWERKRQQKEPPYTDDPILRKYRFCNVYRELDKQTIDVHSQLKKHTGDFPLWLLNIAFHRLVCKPSTVKKIGLLSFSEKNNKRVYDKLTKLERPKYGNAYVFPISAIQKSEYPTREEFFCFYLPQAMKSIAKEIDGFHDITVSEALDKILPLFKFNLRFHWTEILIDVAYQFPTKIDLFKDFPIGPGATPTFKALDNLGDPIKICNALVSHTPKDFPYLKYEGKKVVLSAENWEGIACEFRKYTNLKKGKGRKRIYQRQF